MGLYTQGAFAVEHPIATAFIPPDAGEQPLTFNVSYHEPDGSRPQPATANQSPSPVPDLITNPSDQPRPIDEDGGPNGQFSASATEDPLDSDDIELISTLTPLEEAQFLFDQAHREIITNNRQLGVYLLELAAKNEFRPAIRVLSVLRMKEDSNDLEARAILEAIIEDDIKAKAHLGLMLANLEHPHLNEVDRGIQLLHDAHDKNSLDATYGLYLAYRGSDLDDALTYLYHAADRGHVQATKAVLSISNLSTSERQRWLRQAAVQNDIDSMYEYANGLLIRKYSTQLTGYSNSREFEAYFWLQRASSLGHKGAKSEISYLSGVEFELIANDVSMDDLSKLLIGSTEESREPALLDEDGDGVLGMWYLEEQKQEDDSNELIHQDT